MPLGVCVASFLYVFSKFFNSHYIFARLMAIEELSTLNFICSKFLASKGLRSTGNYVFHIIYTCIG